MVNVLYVDDERHNLTAFKAAFRRDFNIFIAELNSRIGNKASNKLQVGYTALRDFRSAHSPSYAEDDRH